MDIDQASTRPIHPRIAGYRLTTAEILYRLPDHPTLLQSFLWQEFDIAPLFPELRRFLTFWQREIHGPLHSVRVGQAGLVGASDWRHAEALMHLH